jgi:hypothetical protein
MKPLAVHDLSADGYTLSFGHLSLPSFSFNNIPGRRAEKQKNSDADHDYENIKTIYSSAKTGTQNFRNFFRLPAKSEHLPPSFCRVFPARPGCNPCGRYGETAACKFPERCVPQR